MPKHQKLPKEVNLPQEVGITDESQLSSPFNPGFSKSEMFEIIRLAGESVGYKPQQKQKDQGNEKAQKKDPQKPEAAT